MDHSASPSARLRRDMASRSRDFTVPSGMPSSVAIWLCGLSAKKDNSTTWIWSAGRSFSASRRRDSSSADHHAFVGGGAGLRA